MPALTRRRSTDAREECLHVYYGDVRVGTIAIRAGVPHDEDPWEWICGYYPGSDPGERRYGRAASFEAARAAFEAAWREYLPRRSEADFQAWRDQEAWTERKYAMWAAGERMPTQMASSLMTCPCGETFDSHRLEHTVIHVPHITAAHTGTRH